MEIKKILMFLFTFILLCSFASAGNVAAPWTYFSFNNTATTTYLDDSNVNSKTLENYSTTHITSEKGCKLDTCVEFDGVSTHNLRATPNQFWQNNTGSTTHSLSFWVNFTGTGYYSIISNAIAGLDYLRIGIENNYNGLIYDWRIESFPGGGRGYAEHRVALNDGKWHHIVLVADSTAHTLDGYVDGEKITWAYTLGSGTYLGNWFNNVPTDPALTTQIGGVKSSTVDAYWYDGKLDEFLLYDFDLTGPAVNCSLDNTSQVCQLWNDGRAWRPINLSTTYSAYASIQPTNPNNGTQLTGFCEINATTPDTVTIENQWYQNGELIANFSQGVYNTGTTYNVSYVTASSLGCGDTWEFKCRGYNTSYSDWSSDTAEIACTTNTTIKVRTENTLSGQYLSANYTVYNSTGHYVYGINNTPAGFINIVLGPGDNYTVSAMVDGAVSASNETIEVPFGETRELTLSASLLITANIYDEAASGINGTNVAFDITKPDYMNFILYCKDDETIIQNISSNPYNFNLACDYRKFEVFLSYPTQNYYRRYIEDSDILNATGSFNVYLADLYNDTMVEIEFVLVDFGNEYINPRVVLKKVINDDIVVISADYTSFGSVTTYLLQNEEYYIEVQSDNYPTINYGYYTPSTSETKYLSLYDISLAPNPTGVSGANYATWSSNSTGVLNAFMYYNDTDSYTSSINWTLHINSSDGQVIHSEISTLNDVILATNISFYENTTIVSTLKVVRTQSPLPDYSKIIHIGSEEEITLPIKEHYGQTYIDWFITIILGLLLLYGTTKTVPLTILTVGILAAALKAFGWYSLSAIYIALIILIGLVLLLKKGETNVAQ